MKSSSKTPVKLLFTGENNSKWHQDLARAQGNSLKSYLRKRIWHAVGESGQCCFLPRSTLRSLRKPFKLRVLGALPGTDRQGRCSGSNGHAAQSSGSAPRNGAKAPLSDKLLAEATRWLEEECGNSLPFCSNLDEYEMERMRFATIKLSKGNIHKLLEAIDEARMDWRDLLMAADFGFDVNAHEVWAKEVLGKL